MAGLLELARKLHQERLFVRSEQESIYQLNDQIRQRSEQLSHMFWATRQHHLNLNHFITNSSHGTPTLCSQRATQLDNVRFVDAYKELGYQESVYGDFLRAFRNNPTLSAACLAYAEKLALEATQRVVQSVVLGVYGNSIMCGNHHQILELMETLLLLQLARVEQPRRILHKGNAAFCIVYRLFTESLLQGKLFLTSALHKPIMQVLMDDELYLERDSKKILDCFSQVEIEKRFGKQGDPEFEKRIKEHLEHTEQHLFEICQGFIDSLHAAMFCFPQSMGWVIARAYNIVKDAGLVTPSEARALCADLMLQMFICPAIVNPELFGVTGDAPISEFTRFNLMQIAQVLQVLALWDENTKPEGSLYSRFQKSCMSSILDKVISTWHTDGVPPSNSTSGFVDSAVFLTCPQLAELIQLLKDIQLAEVRGVDQSSLAEVLSHLPENPPSILTQATPRRQSTNLVITQNGVTALDGDPSGVPGSPQNGNVGVGLGSDIPSPITPRPGGYPSEAGNSITQSGKKLFSKSVKASRGKSVKHAEVKMGSGVTNQEGSRSIISKSGSGSGDSLEDSKSISDQSEVVLVISLSGTSGSNTDPPGLLSENEVIEMQSNNRESESDALAAPSHGTLNDVDSERMDKRLRFSLYSTDLSELAEGGLGAISSTSGSSIEDLDQTESVQADDTSSFRGASSHGNQDEEDEMEEGDLESIPHTNNDEALKALERKLPTSRESIEDKMRKFEIRSQLGVRFGGAVVAGVDNEVDRMGDGSHSTGNVNYLDTRSDTWSTDAYASDSETATEHDEAAGQADLMAGQAERRLREIAENPDQEQLRTGTAGPYLALLPRDEDSRSDVWSVEVLPSDSEPPDIKPEDRLQELESESTAGAEDHIDQLDDNRSRASTPGLSAASGVSGTSGLSLVSDNVHAKVGEEHGSSSERSFGKTPSSISPDADDMITSNRGLGSGPSSSRFSAGGSSHSSGSGEGPSTNSSARPQTAPSSSQRLLIESQIQSVNYGGTALPEGAPINRIKPSGVNGVMRRSKSASPAYPGRVPHHPTDQKDPVSPVTIPSGASHVTWPDKPGKLKHQGGKKEPNYKPDGYSHGMNFEPGYMDAGVTNSPLSGALPEASSTPDDSGPPAHDVVMETGHHTNTIKRSPYKQDAFTRDRMSAFNSVPSSLARDIAADAAQLDQPGLDYFNKSSAKAGHESSQHHPVGQGDSLGMNNHPKSGDINHATLRNVHNVPATAATTFVPITSSATYSPSPPLAYHDIASFDPVQKDPPISAPPPQILQNKMVTTGNSLLNMNSMSAALVDLNMGSIGQPNNSQGVDQQSQVPSPISANVGGARSKLGSKSNSIDHDTGRGMERKKSWWKSPRIPVLSTKRKNTKTASIDDPSFDPGNGKPAFLTSPTSPNGPDGNVVKTPKSIVTSQMEASSSLLASGDDIMQKYMKKAASNHSSPKPAHRETPATTGTGITHPSAELGSPASHEQSKLDLSEFMSSEKKTDAQSINTSSLTDPTSTPGNLSSSTSDRTMTTVTQGTSPNLSLPSDEKPAKSVPVKCPDYHPDSQQLLSDAQRKLRLMLATTESLPESNRFTGLMAGFGSAMFSGYSAHCAQLGTSQDNRDRLKRSGNNAREEIISFLRLQLAEGVSLQDHSRIAQIHETMRCVESLDVQGCKTLFQNLWKDYKQRSTYIAYLVRTKQALLTTSSYLQHLFLYTEKDQETCRRYLTSVCVNLFLKQIDSALRNFKTKFRNSTVADEKVSLVRSFLSMLYGRMSQDPMWESAGEEQLLEAERAIERSVFVYVYKLALYPNGDGDVLRDQLYDKHISHLAATATPHHPALQIPSRYLKECPWPSAQAEARSINAYKTPRDKLAAVLRCCNTIMNLLKLADEGMVPGADDFTPVLVYVLIMAKPPNLLSTVQYITSFIGDDLSGEDSYWWMQFTAATEFIKTID